MLFADFFFSDFVIQFILFLFLYKFLIICFFLHSTLKYLCMPMHTINLRCSLENMLLWLTKCKDGDISDQHRLNFSTLDCSQS